MLSLSRTPFAALLPFALGLVLSGCPAGSTGDPEPSDAGEPEPETPWAVAFDADDLGSVSGVWGSGPNDIFATGGDEARGAIMHYNGTDWSLVEPDGAGLLVWSYGFGPDDVYAVGVGGTFLHYDGTGWASIDAGTDEDLWGVFGFANDDIWVVGGNPQTDEPILFHYDGTAVTHTQLTAEQNPVGARSLFKIWGIGSKLFAVGARGLVLSYENGDWVVQNMGPEADEDFVSLWGNSEDHIVAVGGRTGARIATYDGTSWTTIAPSGYGGLNAVFMEDDGTTYVGGVNGFLGTFDGDAAEPLTYEGDFNLTQVDIHALWGDGEGKVYGVGGTFLAPHIGVGLVRD